MAMSDICVSSNQTSVDIFTAHMKFFEITMRIHLLNKHLQRSYFLPGTVLGIGDTEEWGLVCGLEELTFQRWGQQSPQDYSHMHWLLW